MGYFQTLAQAFLGHPNPGSGYFGATMGRRTIHIGTSTRGASSLALSDGPMLLARARKADMDNPLARNAINAFDAEVIGTGIRPHSTHSNADKRLQLEREFALWVPQASAARRIGPDGKGDSLQSLYGQEALVCRNAVVAGEAFARLRPRLASDLSKAGLRVPLQVDLIEPEQLAWWRMSGDMASPDNLIRGGIEFDRFHQRVAYHFYREHPGDSTLWPNAWEVVRVPAASILHVVEFQQGSQIRGISALAPILVALADLDDYDDAERLRQKLGAYLFGWKKTLNPDMDPLQQQGRGTMGNDTAPQGDAFVEASPGQLTMFDANQNEDFGFYAHPGVANTYESFMRVQRQTLATAMRVTYSMATGDHSSTTFMNARIALMTLRRQWRQFQEQTIVQQFCRPLWRAWLDAAALAGVIDAGDYRKNPEEYLNVEWSGQPWEWVDPIKDVESVRMEIESCLTSREAEVARRGRDVTEVDAAIARDHERERSLGIAPIYGASRATITEPPGDNPDLPDSAPPGTPATGGKK